MNIQVKIGDQIFDVEVGDLSARPILATIAGETFEVWPEEAAPAAVLPTVVQAAVPAASALVASTPPAPASAPAPAQRPSPAPAAAPAVNGENKSKVLAAPIPGVIVSISVKPGETVTKGQELIGLEAMKMKNAIRATRDGTIAAVHVAVGDHVQKGHILVEFTD